MDLESFEPFKHKDFTLVNGFISHARSDEQSPADKTLTNVLIFMNAVDYVASHLLNNLYTMTFLVTNFETNGVIYQKQKTIEKLTLGQMINRLSEFEFPNKSIFIQELRKFSRLRNAYAHRLLSLTETEKTKIDKDVHDMITTAERILNCYDLIAQGMLQNWKLYKLQIGNRYTYKNETEEINQKGENKKDRPQQHPTPTN